MLNGSVEGSYGNSKVKSPFNLVEKTFILLPLIILCIASIFGNVMVFVTYFRRKYLQRPANYFILSLATSDLYIVTFSVHLFTMYMILGYWPIHVLHYPVCVTILVLDYSLNQSSVLGVVLIATDRYFCITHPHTYPHKRTELRVKSAIAVKWSLSFAIWATIVISYSSMKGSDEVAINLQICDIGTPNNITPKIIVFTTFYAFPISIMIYYAIHLVYVLWNMKLMLQQQVNQLPNGTNKSKNETNNSCKDTTFIKQSTTGANPHEGKIKNDNEISNISPCFTLTNKNYRNSSRNKRNMQNHHQADNFISAPYNEKHEKGKKTSRKTAMSLNEYQRISIFTVTLVFIFLIATLPQAITMMIKMICNDCVSRTWLQIAALLSYLNSIVNPLCYAVGNKNFLRAFKSILGKKQKKDQAN